MEINENIWKLCSDYLKWMYIIGVLSYLLSTPSLSAQDSMVYKEIDTLSLRLVIYEGTQKHSSKYNPALIFFFGGGWSSGTTNQFKPHAEYLSKLGITCFLADYRVKKRHDTSPFDALMDAKSAIRFLKSHAQELGIDSSRIIAAGGSAGGHLAAATALIAEYNDPKDDLTISPKPAALVLFNPVIDNGPGGYGYKRIGEEYPNFSPLHNIRGGAPPTLFLLGTKDHLVPVATAKYYRTVMERVGSRCDLILYEDQGHGFFNHGKDPFYLETLTAAEAFLRDLGFIVND